MLLFLGAGLFLGLLGESDAVQRYGDSYRLRLPRNAHTLKYNSYVTSRSEVLWSKDDPSSPLQPTDRHIVLTRLTPGNDGLYSFFDQHGKKLSTTTIEVTEQAKIFQKSPGENLSFVLDLERESCNIYFYPGKEYYDTRTIVQEGSLAEHQGNVYCGRFKLLEPCGILVPKLKRSCSGRFEVRDLNDYLALTVTLEMHILLHEQSYFGIGVGVFLTSCCCYCLRRCCCGKSESKKEAGDADGDDESDPHPRQSDSNAVRQTLANANRPFTYSAAEAAVHRDAERTTPAFAMMTAPADSKAFPVASDPDPRFELKGAAFASAPAPLSSDSTYCDVYTSDKLNFL